ncbi:hypothetical protein Syun_014766 [Stephania yunnanensis]|uniref:RING-type E3 ubiquitin transferase n=1 Tax=Stephania yunnanensis TaxID=152371 RepID=A0AAP0JL10_9MAGN
MISEYLLLIPAKPTKLRKKQLSGMGAACSHFKQESRSRSMSRNAHHLGSDVRLQFSDGTRGQTLLSEKGNVQRVQGGRSMKTRNQSVLVSFQDESLQKSEKGETPNDTCTESMRGNSIVLPGPEEEDICSTCLDGYDMENPKILCKCKHHYHLPCILEWKERSNTCPICGKVLDIDETYQGI